MNLAMLVGYAENKSGDQVIADLVAGLKAREFPMDRPIQDEMSIGGGPDHDGHDHDQDTE